jgi:hypothetical protein
MILESIEKLALTVGAVVGSPASQQDSPDGLSAHQAGLTGAKIDPVLELEKAFYPRRIHVVRNGRPTQRDGLLKNSLQGGVEAVEFGSFQVAGHPARPYAGTEKTLVSIDIPHSMEKLLIEQSSLDGCAPVPEERGEFVPRDMEGFLASASKAGGMNLHTPETPGIHKAEFPP